MRVILFIALTYIALIARENPFFPTESMDSMPITSNQITKYPPLKRVAISLPDQARILKEITVSYKNLDGSIEKKSIEVERYVDWHIPLFVSQSYSPRDKAEISISKAENKREYIDFKFINFTIGKKKVLIHTKDKLIRNFLLVNPHRIVLDFKREANFLSYEKILTSIPFKKLRMGNHDGYYRVVISLDGRYEYQTDTIDSGYRVQIH